MLYECNNTICGALYGIIGKISGTMRSVHFGIISVQIVILHLSFYKRGGTLVSLICLMPQLLKCSII